MFVFVGWGIHLCGMMTETFVCGGGLTWVCVSFLYVWICWMVGWMGLSWHDYNANGMCSGILRDWVHHVHCSSDAVVTSSVS